MFARETSVEVRDLVGPYSAPDRLGAICFDKRLSTMVNLFW